MKKFILISSLLLLAACVSVKAPNNINKAKKKAKRHVEGLTNIVEKHPKIGDSVKTVNKGKLTFEAVEDSVIQTVSVDSSAFDSLAFEFAKLYAEYEEALEISESYALEEVSPTSSVRKSPSELQDVIIKLQQRLRKVRDDMIKNVTDSLGNFTFEDKNILFESTFKDGRRFSNYVIKERSKEYDQTVIQPTIDATPEPTTFSKIIDLLGWTLLVVIIAAVGYMAVKLYLKFKP